MPLNPPSRRSPGLVAEATGAVRSPGFLSRLKGGVPRPATWLPAGTPPAVVQAVSSPLVLYGGLTVAGYYVWKWFKRRRR